MVTKKYDFNKGDLVVIVDAINKGEWFKRTRLGKVYKVIHVRHNSITNQAFVLAEDIVDGYKIDLYAWRYELVVMQPQDHKFVYGSNYG
jgi:hypothetical protein